MKAEEAENRKSERDAEKENINIRRASNRLSPEEDHIHTAGLISETCLSRFLWLLKPAAVPHPRRTMTSRVARCLCGRKGGRH